MTLDFTEPDGGEEGVGSNVGASTMTTPKPFKPYKGKRIPRKMNPIG